MRKVFSLTPRLSCVQGDMPGYPLNWGFSCVPEPVWTFWRRCTRWFKYDRDWLCVNKSQFVPVIFEPPCTLFFPEIEPLFLGPPTRGLVTIPTGLFRFPYNIRKRWYYKITYLKWAGLLHLVDVNYIWSRVTRNQLSMLSAPTHIPRCYIRNYCLSLKNIHIFMELVYSNKVYGTHLLLYYIQFNFNFMCLSWL